MSQWSAGTSNHEESGPFNLFLLRSPFQAFVATRIIEQYSVGRPLVLYLSRENRDKGWHYFRALRPIASDAVFLRVEQRRRSVVRDWRGVASVLRWLGRRRIDRVFVANFPLWYFRVIARWSGGRPVTFDEGAGNFSPGTWATWERRGTRDDRLAELLGGFSLDQFRTESAEHYTVRMDLPNFFQHGRRPVDLHTTDRGFSARSSRDLYVGQPVEEAYDSEAVRRFFEHREAAGGDYFPHPREGERPFSTIRSPLIIEDYVASSPVPIRLIGPFSTAFLTITGVDKVYLDLDGDPIRRRIMELAGCEVVPLH